MQSMSCTPPQQVQQINALPVQGTSSQKIMPAHTIIQPDQGPYSGQHFIVTITGEHGGEQENIQMAHGAAGQVVYQSPQSYASYNNQAGMYTAVTGTYDQAPGCTVQMSSGGIGGIQGQILTHGGESYLVQGNILEGDGQGLSHSIRASPASDPSGQRTSHFDVKCWQREVQWLMDNYETAEGVSLPRSTLYNHYLRHCQENKLEPMNPASFGKLIRSVFLGLRTRRLGTRGNSQYHYYGIRIKSTSRLNQLANDQFMFSRQNSMNSVKRFKASYDGRDSNSGSMLESSPASQTSLGVLTSHQQQHQQFLGDASAAMPEFGHIELSEDHLPHGINRKHLLVFEELYKDHCEAFLEVVVNLQFPFVEALWMSFWKNEHGDPGFEEMEQRLPKEKLYFLCELPAVQQYVLESDYAFYQALVQVLIPDVLRPIPGALTQSIRNFAKSLEGWLKNAMNGAPEEMIQTKVNAVSAFAQILRRYTSLNHLAQAARAVLQNGSQISQMLADINKVDFSNVQEQASWVCQCSDETVHQLQEDFKKTLEHQTSLEQWASWLEDVVSQALSPHESSPDFARAARQFLLKWSFYSSMVIRDLTLRSAASFGSFHLIRLLYDEYMFYLVEQKVAAATGETSIAVMGKVRQVQNSERVLLFDTPSNGDGISVYRQMDTVASDGPFSTGVLDVSLAKPLITVNFARSSVLASAQHPSASLFRVSTASDASAFFLQQSAATTISDSAQSSSVLADSMNLSASSAGTEPSGILVNGGLGLVKQ